MDDRAREIANLLLREGALDKSSDEHRAIYAEVTGDPALFDAIESRLEQVGYALVDRLTHLGVRIASDVVDASTLRNNMGVHAGHIRLIVYLWVHLVYREWVNLRRDVQTAPPGAAQNTLLAEDDEEDDQLWISYQQVQRDFGEVLAKTTFKGYLTQLKKWRFIGYHKKSDRIWADASLYTLIDLHRMEDFVTELARRLGMEEPDEAVAAIATGREVPDDDDERADANTPQLSLADDVDDAGEER